MSGSNPLEERDKITDDAFDVLVELFIEELDPWPLSNGDKGVMFGFLLAEAHKRGYETVDEAYRDLDG